MEPMAANKKENEESIESKRNQILKEPMQRQTAFKLRIADILAGNIIANDRFKFVELGDKRIVRVNLIANVIDKFISETEKKYAGLTLDDASGQIRVKTFGEDISKFEGVEIGDSISVIGVLRYFNNELYVLPEIIRRLDPKWLVVRKLELGQGAEYTAQTNIQTQIKSNNITSDGQETGKVDGQKMNIERIEDERDKEGMSEKARIKNEIMGMLKEENEGVDIDKIIMALKFDTDGINQVITEMLEDAEVYEPKPGRIRLL